MFLELVFEPKMVDESYEFKLGKFAHLALKIIYKYTNITWLIEGNIEGYSKNIDYPNLASLFIGEVKDQHILNLYWELVCAKFVNNRKQELHNLIGVLQGRILSPMLSKVYLHEFDV